MLRSQWLRWLKYTVCSLSCARSWICLHSNTAVHVTSSLIPAFLQGCIIGGKMVIYPISPCEDLALMSLFAYWIIYEQHPLLCQCLQPNATVVKCSSGTNRFIITCGHFNTFVLCGPLWQEALRQRLKLLTEEKSEHQTQLMDCRLQIEREGKVR